MSFSSKVGLSSEFRPIHAENRPRTLGSRSDWSSRHCLSTLWRLSCAGESHVEAVPGTSLLLLLLGQIRGRHRRHLAERFAPRARPNDLGVLLQGDVRDAQVQALHLSAVLSAPKIHASRMSRRIEPLIFQGTAPRRSWDHYQASQLVRSAIASAIWLGW